MNAKQWEAQILAGQTNTKDFTVNRRWLKANKKYQTNPAAWPKLVWYAKQQDVRILNALKD